MNNPLIVEIEQYYTDKTIAATYDPKIEDIFQVACEGAGYTPKDMVCKLLEDRTSELQLQFLQLQKEIQPWLIEEFRLRPSANGFTEWFIANKYEPALRAKKPKIIVILSKFPSSKVINITFRFLIPFNELPAVKYEDIMEYCFYLRERLETAYESMHTHTTAFEVISKQQLQEHLDETYHWLLPNEKLEAFYKALDGTYIDCSWDTFKGVFGHATFIGPIKWLKEERTLIFLVKFLQANGCLEAYDPQNWILFQKLFIRDNGEQYNPDNLKSQNLNVMLDGPSQLQKKLLKAISHILY